MVFQFEHVGLDHGPSGKWDHKPLGLQELKDSFRQWQEGLSDVGWNSLYWNNHDQPRAVSRFGNDGEYWLRSAKLLAAVLHLQRGTPFIFQGEELGMTNADFETMSEIRDIESLNFFADASLAGHAAADAAFASIRRTGRDNARTPMQWSSAPNAGFTHGEPWIVVNGNASWVNASTQSRDPESIFSFYRELIRLRHTDPIVTHGAFEMIATDHPTLFAYRRRLGESAIVVLANYSDKTLPIAEIVEPAPEGADVKLLLGNYPSVPDQFEAPLGPWEVRVIRVSHEDLALDPTAT
jgi:oligo-1,6-glucosidase